MHLSADKNNQLLQDSVSESIHFMRQQINNSPLPINHGCLPEIRVSQNSRQAERLELPALILDQSPSQAEFAGQFSYYKRQPFRAASQLQFHQKSSPLNTERIREPEDFSSAFNKKQANFMLSKVLDTYNRQKGNIQNQTSSKDIATVENQQQLITGSDSYIATLRQPVSQSLYLRKSNLIQRKKSLPPLPFLNISYNESKTIEHGENSSKINKQYLKAQNDADEGGQGFDFSFSQMNQDSEDENDTIKENTQPRFRRKNRISKHSEQISLKFLRDSTTQVGAQQCIFLRQVRKPS